MKKKICSKCGEEKDICEFGVKKNNKDGIMSYCKLCKKHINSIWKKNNSELAKKIDSEWRKNNLEYRKKYMKNYRTENKTNITIYNNQYEKNRKKIDPIYKLKILSRSRIHHFLKQRKITKKCKSFEIIGISPIELKEYLEKKFTEGMNWENQGKWHIDHIIPLSSGKTEEEIYKLCHYTNLQPLWAEDNIKKGSK